VRNLLEEQVPVQWTIRIEVLEKPTCLDFHMGKSTSGKNISEPKVPQLLE